MIELETEEDTDIVGLRDSLQRLTFDQLLQELGKMKLKLGIIIPLIFEKGKQKGLKEVEIRNKIKEMIDVPERTLNTYLPEGAKKHRYPKNRKLAEFANYNEIIEDFSNTGALANSFNALNNNTKFDIDKNYGKSDSEPTSDVISRSVQKSAHVYGDWTVEELISKYEEIVVDNVYLDLQFEEATSRIEELEQFLEEQGLMIDD